MNVLCLCQYGHNRSMGLAQLLQSGRFGQHVALPAGWMTTDPNLQTLLYTWADRIVVLEPYMTQYVPQPFQAKVRCFDVGPDGYGNPRHPDLVRKLECYLTREGLR